MDLSREEFIIHLDLVHDGIKDISMRLGTVEVDVAVLKDRSQVTHDAATAQAKTTAGKWGMALAGAGAIVEIMHQWLSK